MYAYPHPYCLAYWGQAVKAYWPGSDEGYFKSAVSCSENYWVEVFSAGQGQTNALSCAQSASEVDFGPFVF
jgi:hypothetical protein